MITAPQVYFVIVELRRDRPLLPSDAHDMADARQPTQRTIYKEKYYRDGQGTDYPQQLKKLSWSVASMSTRASRCRRERRLLDAPPDADD